MSADDRLPRATETPSFRPDEWSDLRRLTAARIALGRAGASLPTSELLAFGLAHARARDAVHTALRRELLAERLVALGLTTFETNSRAGSRSVYLKRPDLGRQLAEGEDATIRALAASPVDIAIVIADGLSATAVQKNAPAFLDALIPLLRHDGLTIAPAALVAQGRVAIGDPIGALLQARLALVLIGERPGLSAADSLGVYSTYEPRPGRSDADRNCISNIRPDGLAPEVAAATAHWLIKQTLARRLSGVGLKDGSAVEAGGSLAHAAPAPVLSSAITEQADLGCR